MSTATTSATTSHSPAPAPRAMLAAALHVRDIADTEALEAAADLLQLRARSIDPHVATLVLQPDLDTGTHVIGCSLRASPAHAATHAAAALPAGSADVSSGRAEAQQVAAILRPLRDVRLAACVLELCAPRPTDGLRRPSVLWLAERRIERLDATTVTLTAPARPPATIPQAFATVRATAAEVARASAHAAAAAITLITARGITGPIDSHDTPAGLDTVEHELVTDALLRALEIHQSPPHPGSLEFRPDARQVSWICQRTSRRRTLPARDLANVATIGITR